MSKKTKAFLYNVLSFGILFAFLRYYLIDFTSLTGYMRPVAAFMVAFLIAPKFQAGFVNGKEMIYMRWIFMKGAKKIE